MIALFDFDGVIMDTETQYTLFWDRVGKDLTGIDGFGHIIKGQTLKQIFSRYFPDRTPQQLAEIEDMINALERNMVYEYIPGAYEFMISLKKAGIPMAIVTSSNEIKMSNVHKAHPELASLVDRILTSDDFSRSKPDPECFLKGMELLGGKAEETLIFEDSLHGIHAGRSAGGKVIGLATTNPRETICPLCDVVLDDFRGISLESLMAQMPS